jgi:hypothetical protein
MTQQGTGDGHIRLRARGMTPEQTLAAARHREHCAECAAAAVEDVDSRAAGELWAEMLRSSLGEHLRGEELFDYVDGRLPDVATAAARAHLEHCAACRDDVADLRPLRRRPMMRWQEIALAAAAVIAVVLATSLLRRTSKPPMIASAAPHASVSPALHTSEGRPAAWRALVDDALSKGRIDPPPLLATLHQPAETVRGQSRDTASPVSPDGVVVDDSRPRFRWSGPRGATYTVSVFTGDQETARSAPLRQTVWTPNRQLERGRAYRWQVEARLGKETSIIPPAPQPVPAFFLLDSAAHQEMESARRSDPGDHLLLGVLAAHHGLRQEAIEQLTLYRAAHPGSSAASSLLDSVRAWEGGRRQ